jgi:hypothetical protein
MIDDQRNLISRKAYADFSTIEISMFKKGNYFNYDYIKDNTTNFIQGRIIDIHFNCDFHKSMEVTIFIY